MISLKMNYKVKLGYKKAREKNFGKCFNDIGRLDCFGWELYYGTTDLSIGVPKQEVFIGDKSIF